MTVIFTIFADDMAELIDTHSHIYDEAFDADFDDVVSRAKENGLTALIMPGIDISCYDRMLSAADRLPGFAFPCIGLHPTSVGDSWRDEYRFVKEHLGDRRFYAIGEVGLDFHWSDKYRKEQIEVFENQIEIAAERDLPLIIHLRDATGVMLNVLEDMKGIPIRGSFHAFSGSYETYKEYLKYGDFKFGIGGVATYKNAGVAGTIASMSLSDIILETDCPWLTPVPHRGQRNESSYVRFVAEKVSSIKGVSVEEVGAVTSRNARSLFKM